MIQQFRFTSGTLLRQINYGTYNAGKLFIRLRTSGGGARRGEEGGRRKEGGAGVGGGKGKTGGEEGQVGGQGRGEGEERAEGYRVCKGGRNELKK